MNATRTTITDRHLAGTCESADGVSCTCTEQYKAAADREQAQNLHAGDVIAPMTTDEPATVLNVFTWEGAYGRTTELTYRYLDAPKWATTTMRTLATRTFVLVETESANV